jgi:hypothetical protein
MADATIVQGGAQDDGAGHDAGQTPSIAAFEAGAGCGARQLASRWSAGRRRAPRKGPHAPGPPLPLKAYGSRNLGVRPAFAKPVGELRTLPGASRRSNPLFEGRKKERLRAGPGARIQSPGTMAHVGSRSPRFTISNAGDHRYCSSVVRSSSAVVCSVACRFVCIARICVATSSVDAPSTLCSRSCSVELVCW